MFKLRNPIRSFLVGLTAIQAHVRVVVESNARLDNENTALRRELATAKEERNALGRDLYALSRGEAVETMAGEAVEQRMSRLADHVIVKIDSVHQDSETWFAARTSFINVQESPCGFGATPETAVAALLKDEERGDQGAPESAPLHPGAEGFAS